MGTKSLRMWKLIQFAKKDNLRLVCFCYKLISAVYFFRLEYIYSKIACIAQILRFFFKKVSEFGNNFDFEYV